MRPRSARPRKTSEPTPQSSAVQRHRGLIIAVVIALLLGGIPFGLGKYIEFNSPGPFDSGAYVYSAKHLLDGARWGVDEVSSAYPGTLLVNIVGVKLFGFSDTGPKIVQMILQLGALIFMFYTLRRVFGIVAAVLGTVLAAVYLSAPLIAKFGNVKEQYMLAFVISAACGFLLHEFTGKRFWLVLSGALCVQPYFFKPTGLSVVFAIIGYLLITRLVGRRWKKLFIDSVLFLAGATAGLLFPATLFIWQDRLAKFASVLPVMAVKLGWVILLSAAALFAAVYYGRKYQVLARLRSVPKRIYRRGIIALAAALIIGILTVAAANIVITQLSDYPTGTVAGDIVSYIKSIPMVSIPLKLATLLLNQLQHLHAAAGLSGGYVAESRKLVTLSELAPKILRYYKALSVPIAAALLSILIAVFAVLKKRAAKQPLSLQSRLVWMLAAWWIMDMAFVWVSPHSYEQYYLPLCASAAVLSGYAAWKWQQAFTASPAKMPWLVTGVMAAIMLAGLSIPIFAGQRYSPDTGTDYTANGGPRRRGFAEGLKRVQEAQSAPWQAAGDFIRTHSTEDDRIYVWGWVPGIYVQAQRLAPVPTAYEANMHFTPPGVLARRMARLADRLRQNPPKFIVDTRKQHFPFDRPPLELWPVVPPGLAGNDRPRLTNPADPREIAKVDAFYFGDLKGRVSEDEARRYEAMEPMRRFVMENYRFAGLYGQHVLFERKPQPL